MQINQTFYFSKNTKWLKRLNQYYKIEMNICKAFLATCVYRVWSPGPHRKHTAEAIAPASMLRPCCTSSSPGNLKHAATAATLRQKTTYSLPRWTRSLGHSSRLYWLTIVHLATVNLFKIFWLGMSVVWQGCYKNRGAVWSQKVKLYPYFPSLIQWWIRIGADTIYVSIAHHFVKSPVIQKDSEQNSSGPN